MTEPPTHVHLVGSIGLDTVEEIFRTVGRLLGPYLRRIPDGEVGGRRLWISWQYPVLRANALVKTISHPLAYMHMPVPADRIDDAFHQPFAELSLPPDCELFLGVVSAKDGAEGAKARIAAARRYVPSFGIATECGMARARFPETVHTLLQIHADVCARN
jgi:hypothetical protein